MVITIMCLIFTGLGSLNLIGTVLALAHNVPTLEAYVFYGGDMRVTLGVQVLVYAYCLVSDILGVCGVMQNNKCLLLPFIIKLALQILGFFGYIVFFVVKGSNVGDSIHREVENHELRHAAGTVSAIFFFLLIVPLIIAIGITTYFLVIVARYYSELSSGVISGQREGIVLQPLSPQPTAPNAGVATVYVPPGGQVYVPPGGQNVSYGYQQQQPPAYQQQGYGYPATDPGMKQPV